MLDPKKTLRALSAKRELLQQASEEAARQAANARDSLIALSSLDERELAERLARHSWPGALPTEEHGRHPDQVLHFPYQFSTHKEAREWAATVLQQQPTFAADGSEISPLSEYSLPVAAAQAAWYLNYHDPQGKHEKDVEIQVLIGQELYGTEGDAVSRVQTERFLMEVNALISFIDRAKDIDPKPICFFDGPLVISFANQYSAHRRTTYVQAISRLLEASERHQVPLLGYVASSGANDVLNMLHSADLLSDKPRISDAVAFGPLLTNWGDRSVSYTCARDDKVLTTYRRADGSSLSDQISFCYLRTTGEGRPARLEFPRWLLQNHEYFSSIVDIVRAECIVGLGYPYAIEAADEAAVLQARDREHFMRLVARFAATVPVDLTVTSKARSKRRRRLGQ